MDSILIILIGTAIVLFCIIRLKLHAAVSLLLAALITALLTSPDLIITYAIQSGMSEQDAIAFSNISVGRRLANAFGNTSGKIGILIALASIIGIALMKSGGAERIIRGLLSLFGKKNASLALLTGSFTLAIPVFFDTVFYLMIPLVKSVAVRNPKKFSLYLMAIIAGGVMAHSLIPPTPGPLFVAQEMGIDLGIMIIGGLGIGIITITVGYSYALWANKKWELPMRDTPDITVEDLKQLAEKDTRELPGLWFSLLPILLPILLITGNTYSKMLEGGNLEKSSFAKILSILGDANIALFISALIAMLLLWQQLKDSKIFQKHIGEALGSAAMIILITSAGGAFGQMLQQTGIGVRIGEMAANYQVALLPLAFFVTAAVRSAQGSATVAMITAVGVMGGVATNGLAFHPVYLALAIGCGSKIFSWMNDSGFWIITQMSGMEVKETIRHFSIMMMVMALSGLVAIMILSILMPLV
ncbi:MAG: GntP family gluconate:H+ symporter [Saprospiraceae bacterium]|jgi:GntP family gluconate:H+ symporter